MNLALTLLYPKQRPTAVIQPIFVQAVVFGKGGLAPAVRTPPALNKRFRPVFYKTGFFGSNNRKPGHLRHPGAGRDPGF